jgi:hypothetical protein
VNSHAKHRSGLESCFAILFKEQTIAVVGIPGASPGSSLGQTLSPKIKLCCTQPLLCVHINLDLMIVYPKIHQMFTHCELETYIKERSYY